MNDSKVTLLGVLLAVVCLAFMGGIYYLNGQFVELKEEYDNLEGQRRTLELQTQALQNQKKVFTDAFAELEKYEINVAPSDMNFYEDVQQEVRRVGAVNIVSTRPLGVSRDGRSSFALTLRGDYYGFTQILAAWRKLHTTVRVSTMTVTASRTPETRGEVQAELTVEAIVAK